MSNGVTLTNEEFVAWCAVVRHEVNDGFRAEEARTWLVDLIDHVGAEVQPRYINEALRRLWQ